MAILSTTKVFAADIIIYEEWSNRANSGSKIEWSISPSAGVNIKNPNESVTSVVFNNPGEYLITVVVSDGALSASDSTIITLTEEDMGKQDIILGDQEITVPVNIVLPDGAAVYSTLDCVIDIDVSGSMGGELNMAKSSSTEIFNSLFVGGRDVRGGVAAHSDYVDEYATKIWQLLTPSLSDVKTAINKITLMRGGDGPEAQLLSMYNNAILQPWRDGSLKIYVLFTDAEAHEGPEYATVDQVIREFNSRGIKLISMDTGQSQYQAIVDATGGSRYELSSNHTTVVNDIIDTLTDLSTNLSIRLTPDGAPTGLIKSIIPENYDNINPGDTFSFDVTFSREGVTPGSGKQVYNFTLEIVANELAIVDSIPVQVEVNW